MIINVKTRFLALLFIPMLMGLNSCKKDEIDIDDDVTIDTPVVELAGNETLVTHTEATVFAEVTEDGGGTVSSRGFIYGLVDARPDTVYCKGDAFSVRIEGLTPNTTYRYSAFARNEAGMGHSETLTFTTLDYALPTVSTAPIENITTGSATGGGEVINDGDKPVTERGICWSLEHDPTIDDAHVAAGEGVGVFVCEMTGLEPNTYYYVRAYATNEKGTAYGEEIRFVTDGGALPEVVTKGVSDITLSTALGSGEVTNDGGVPVTERGLCWGRAHNPTLGDAHASAGEGIGHFECEMTGLEQNTIYYVCAYATNSNGTAYGNEVLFVTNGQFVPDVVTYSVSEITQTSAKVSGEVFDDGGAPVTERGICWGTTNMPTIEGNHVGGGEGTGYFVCTLTGLEGNKVYYARAYAVNLVGVAYGDVLEFNTIAYPPAVGSVSITAITTQSAIGSATVTGDGGSAVTERGLCWGTSPNPTTSGTHANSGSGTGEFSVSMTGLIPNTTYHVRAYAVNEMGTSYSDDVSFTTAQEILLPIVTTGQVTGITTTTAIGSGNVVSDGGATVTERGLCWSINHNPTLNDTHGNSGTGLGNFTISMSGLAEGTTYYVRAYATNSVGTSYGDEVGFTTSTTWGNGALAGLFSVNGGQQVRFSQGNLQYQASTNTWRFASNQYDFVGQNNSQLSSSYSGWIDLFGWGTSGYNHGAVCWQPWSSSAVWSHYYAYGSYYYHLYDQSGQADWGYNAISNGGNQTQRWRTLTKEEWMYVFEQRTTATGNRFAKAQVNGVNGVVLLPDNWSVSVHPLNECNNVYVPFETNVVSSSIWSTMEANGAVFLPAAGYRSETEVFSVGVEGNYWSASYADDYDAYYMSVISTNLMPNNVFGRDFGRSVRLVCPAE